MQVVSEIRPGEITVEIPAQPDAGVFFIGRIHTPWASPRDCPRRGDLAGPVCRIEIFQPWALALQSVDQHSHLQILYWMHLARRDLVIQSPRHSSHSPGTFALRSPNRPNPISSSLVALESVEGQILHVRGLDCVNGTPLIDVKPDTCPQWAPAGLSRT